MKALITGITGFVGQYLAEHLSDCGDEVLGTNFDDRWPTDVSARIRETVPLLDWNLPHPICDAARRQIEQLSPDCIYHLAAISVPAECGETEPTEKARAVNIEGTRAVLDLAESLASRPRVLLISSAHVYAPVPSDQPLVREDAELGPIRAYGKTKLQAERLCLAAAENGLDVIVARAFQHTGPRQFPKFLLPEWAEQFARPGPGPIHVLSLDSHLDLSDVRDVVRAYRELLAQSDTHGCYNVGSGLSVRSGDIFKMLLELTGQSRKAVEHQPEHKQQAIADISRLKTDTPWRPEIPLRQTVADTLDYWRKSLRP